MLDAFYPAKMSYCYICSFYLRDKLITGTFIIKQNSVIPILYTVISCLSTCWLFIELWSGIVGG